MKDKIFKLMGSKKFVAAWCTITGAMIGYLSYSMGKVTGVCEGMKEANGLWSSVINEIIDESEEQKEDEN